MKKQDFLVCTFQGDVTVYVAEILNVFADSFECRFVHSESRYTFSAKTWSVLQTTGAFPKGTPLTSHDLYTQTGQVPALNSFVGVTFGNGKSYLGRLITQAPQMVRFLHKGIPVYVFENNRIISSGGIYPKGQSIQKIIAYQPVTDKGNGPVTGIDITKKGLSYNGPEFAMLATQIQGNILKSHGRDHTSHVFFRFNEGMEAEAKSFIKAFAETKLTSAARQKQDSDKISSEKRLARQEARAPQLEALQTFFIGFLLSAKGYDFLQIDTAGFDPDFLGGMKAANDMSALLFDKPVAEWETEYREDIHGMILIAWGGQSRTELEAETAAIVKQLESGGIATVIKTERGDGIKNANGDYIEHFGFVDGISQPLFFQEDLSDLKTEGVETSNWDPLMPADLVLVKDSKDPNAKAYGSYMVFRKLEQNVREFKAAEKRLAEELFGSATPDKTELAGALVTGRFRNGMPLTLSNNRQKIGEKIIDKTLIGKLNDFTYANDPDGARCPFHAHVRKTNPRGSAGSGEDPAAEKRHMMARRGISYGKRSVPPENATVEQSPAKDVGLLFMSFQASIFKQFQHQQEVFANADDTGKDPLVGQGELVNGKQKCAKVYGQASSLVAPNVFGGFVTLKGGEYFFAPSISFLQSIQ